MIHEIKCKSESDQTKYCVCWVPTNQPKIFSTAVSIRSNDIIILFFKSKNASFVGDKNWENMFVLRTHHSNVQTVNSKATIIWFTIPILHLQQNVYKDLNFCVFTRLSHINFYYYYILNFSMSSSVEHIHVSIFSTTVFICSYGDTYK